MSFKLNSFGKTESMLHDKTTAHVLGIKTYPKYNVFDKYYIALITVLLFENQQEKSTFAQAF